MTQPEEPEAAAGPPPVPLARRFPAFLQVLAGLATPVVVAILVLMLMAAVRSSGREWLGIIFVVELVLGTAGLVMLAGRRAPWFAVPAILVSALICFVSSACMNMQI